LRLTLINPPKIDYTRIWKYYGGMRWLTPKIP
jgi:hypothetical protein